MIEVLSLDDTSDILDTDMVMVTHSDGNTEKISGADLNMRNKVIFSANKTLTGTPLKAGNVVRVCFTQDITGLDTSSMLQLEYNEVDKNVKVNKDGTLIDFVATEISSGVYKYVQAYTVLELLYDGTQFIIIGNPVVISDDGFKYYANGDHIADVVAVDNMHSVTSNAVAKKFQSIENLTSSITRNNNYCNYINCFRYGKVVDVYFETKNTSQSNATIATGLPAPKSGFMMYGVEIYGNGSITYTRVESTGNLVAQCNSSYTGIGHITYICE